MQLKTIVIEAEYYARIIVVVYNYELQCSFTTPR